MTLKEKVDQAYQERANVCAYLNAPLKWFGVWSDGWLPDIDDELKDIKGKDAIKYIHIHYRKIKHHDVMSEVFWNFSSQIKCGEDCSVYDFIRWVFNYYEDVLIPEIEEDYANEI